MKSVSLSNFLSHYDTAKVQRTDYQLLLITVGLVMQTMLFVHIS